MYTGKKTCTAAANESSSTTSNSRLGDDQVAVFSVWHGEVLIQEVSVCCLHRGSVVPLHTMRINGDEEGRGGGGSCSR